jgi:methylaspartate ammonia-lyase
MMLAQLRSYIRLRKMALKLVSRAHANSVENIAALARARAADFIWLDGPQLGSVSRLIEAVGICRAAGVGIILAGRPGESVTAAQAACQIALACTPDFLLALPGQGTGMGYALVNQELGRAKRRRQS